MAGCRLLFRLLRVHGPSAGMPASVLCWWVLSLLALRPSSSRYAGARKKNERRRALWNYQGPVHVLN